MTGIKRDNDPWIPLPDDSETPIEPINIGPSFTDPLHQLIDSERYIKTLESKLKKLTKTTNIEPSSKDIISSLTVFHDDQMRRFVNDHLIDALNISSSTYSEESSNPLNFMHRKLHPEKQSLSAEELIELLKEDVLAKIFEEAWSSSTLTSGSLENVAQSTLMDVLTVTQDSGNTSAEATQENINLKQESVLNDLEENWANFDETTAQSPNNDKDVS